MKPGLLGCAAALLLGAVVGPVSAGDEVPPTRWTLDREGVELEMSLHSTDPGEELLLQEGQDVLFRIRVRDTATGEMLRARINDVLKTLTYREREILKLRYGIGDGYTYTLEEVGRIFKVTRERVRQVESKAIRKLQHPVRKTRLASFLSGHPLEYTDVGTPEGAQG